MNINKLNATIKKKISNEINIDEIIIEDNDNPQSAFTEDFSVGLDNWVVSPDSATGYQFEYITDFSDIANLDHGLINIYMSEPEFTSVNDGYVVFAARNHQEVLYALIETANPISVDPLTDAYLSFESLYMAYEFEPHSAAVIAAVGYRSNSDLTQEQKKVRKSSSLLFETI